MSLKVRSLAGLLVAAFIALVACAPSEPAARFGLLRSDGNVATSCQGPFPLFSLRLEVQRRSNWTLQD